MKPLLQVTRQEEDMVAKEKELRVVQEKKEELEKSLHEIEKKYAQVSNINPIFILIVVCFWFSAV